MGGGGITRQLICHKNKIGVPTILQKHVINWYHTVLCHPGMNRTVETISKHLWWPTMREQITAYAQACPTCQKNRSIRNMDTYHPKRQKLKYGIRCVLT